MLIGYASFSMHDQHMDLQKDALNSVSCEKTFVEKLGGATPPRTGLQQSIDTLQANMSLQC